MQRQVLTCFIILLFVAYCAAGLAAWSAQKSKVLLALFFLVLHSSRRLEPRRSLPGHLVQWLCTGWGAREALLQACRTSLTFLLIALVMFYRPVVHSGLQHRMCLAAGPSHGHHTFPTTVGLRMTFPASLYSVRKRLFSSQYASFEGRERSLRQNRGPIMFTRTPFMIVLRCCRVP